MKYYELFGGGMLLALISNSQTVPLMYYVSSSHRLINEDEFTVNQTKKFHRVSIHEYKPPTENYSRSFEQVNFVTREHGNVAYLFPYPT